MINIPVSGGTSGHFIGGTLTVLIVGPSLGIFVIVLVLTVQMFVFQDGGLLAWGANVLNLGILPILTSYLMFLLYFKLLHRYSSFAPMRVIVFFLTSWLAIQVSALLCGLELGLSGLAPTGKIISLMLIIHSGIGVLEGLLTVIIIEFIRLNRPDLMFSFLPQPVLIDGSHKKV
jgi:cobalt/nickel transport system permease protein